jgi:hypothetical protein
MVLLVGTKAGVEVPAGVLLAEVEGLTTDAILHKVHTVLLGRWLGLGSDPTLGSLVGDLEALPLLELLPLLQTIAVTGCVRAGGGELFLEGGEVIAARVDALRGVKAFARLARTAGGHFRVMMGRPSVARELSEDLLSLMALAMEDQHRLEAACIPRCRSAEAARAADFQAHPASGSSQRKRTGAAAFGRCWTGPPRPTVPFWLMSHGSPTWVSWSSTLRRLRSVS